MSSSQTAPSGNVRALAFLGLSVLAGLASVVLIHQVIVSYQQAIELASRPEETATVIVAAGDLYPGVTVTEGDLVQVEVPTRYLPHDESGHLLAFTSPEAVVGRVPRERILANEYVLPDRLADLASGQGLNALIVEGMRAISLDLQDASSVSGFLVPGNLVDVVVTLTAEEDGALPET